MATMKLVATSRAITDITMPKTTHGVNPARTNQSGADTDRQLLRPIRLGAASTSGRRTRSHCTSGGAQLRTKVLYFVAAALVSGLSIGLTSAPLAQAYPNCAAARAAGAAPLYRGQPGYSSKLDRDGDGVACETGSSGRSPVQSIPAPALPSAQVPQPVSTPIPAPALQSGGSGAGGSFETVVTWTGTDCIDITAPDSSPAKTLGTTNHCGGTARFTQEAVGSQMVGADPVMGSAESITCEILVGRLRDSSTRGDGHDVNCLSRADSLNA